MASATAPSDLKPPAAAAPSAAKARSSSSSPAKRPPPAAAPELALADRARKRVRDRRAERARSESP